MCPWLCCRTRGSLPLGGDPLHLSQGLDRGHCLMTPTWGNWCRNHYQHISMRMNRSKMKHLTLDHDVLTSLLVLLAPTTDLVGKAIALVVEVSAVLTSWHTHHQLSLNWEDQ